MVDCLTRHNIKAAKVWLCLHNGDHAEICERPQATQKIVTAKSTCLFCWTQITLRSYTGLKLIMDRVHNYIGLLQTFNINFTWEEIEEYHFVSYLENTEVKQFWLGLRHSPIGEYATR